MREIHNLRLSAVDFIKLKTNPGLSTKKSVVQWKHSVLKSGHWYLLCGDSNCYMKSARNYKALYQQCAKESAKKDRLIAMHHSQVGHLAGECHTLRVMNADQAATIKQYEQLHTQQQATILGQAEKLSLQQIVITDQNPTITSQQTELKRQTKEILRLDNLRYELMNLKKWVHGIRSEKRPQVVGPDRSSLGDQLSLAMDVDSWGEMEPMPQMKGVLEFQQHGVRSITIRAIYRCAIQPNDSFIVICERNR